MNEKPYYEKPQYVINPATGEKVLIQYNEIDSNVKDRNFHKLFLKDFISVMDLVANQKTKLVFWILSNLTKNNLILYTYRQMAEHTDISYATVAENMKTLQQSDFIRKHSSGYYMVNPDIIYKGTIQRRCMTLDVYRTLPKANDVLSNDIMTLTALSKQIEKLQKKQRNLQERVDRIEHSKKNEQME